MDNIYFKVVNIGLNNLERIFEIAFGKYNKAKCYSIINDNKGIILYWAIPAIPDGRKNIIPFMSPLEAKEAAKIVNDWLEKTAVYPKNEYEDDSDIDFKKGWIVSCDSWGHIGSDPYAFVRIEPNWAMYGK